MGVWSQADAKLWAGACGCPAAKERAVRQGGDPVLPWTDTENSMIP